jgi:mono/diheme cytochrome c family protein
MKSLLASLLSASLVSLVLVAEGRQAPVPASSPSVAAPAGAEADAALVKTYCAGCHSDRGKAGGLSLASFEPGNAAAAPEVSERIVRKLAAGMMPPAGARRPAAAELAAFQRHL